MTGRPPETFSTPSKPCATLERELKSGGQQVIGQAHVLARLVSDYLPVRKMLCLNACLSEFSIFSYFLDKQAIGHAFDAFKTARHARARAQKVNRQVIGHANGNAMRCQGRCPITCLLAKCHVRLLACPISADRQVIGQLRGHDIAITLPWPLPVALPWPLPSHCESIAIT